MSSAQSSPYVSKLDTSSEAYRANHAGMTKICGELHDRFKQTRSEGLPKDTARHLERGQLLTRDRIALLVDDDTPTLELCAFGGFVNSKRTPRTGVACIAVVCGVECLILADVPTVRGGAKNETSVEGGLRLLQISIENRLPLISLIQTAGADLTQQDKVFHKGGNTFRLLARRAKMKLPSIAVVFGSSTAGGAYNPGMSDYIVMVKNQAQVYLGGPPLVKMATGEEVSHEELGGATMHSTISGVSDFLAKNEKEALRIARDIVSTFNWQKLGPGPRICPENVEDPLYAADELLGIVSPSVKQPFDMVEVIARIVDGSRITFFKSNFGKTLVCCFAEIFGFPVGIIANNGVLFPDSSQKGAQFISLCNQKDTPILFFHNITGFMVGRQSEQSGLIKYGALMVNAVSNSCVPHISIIMGASFGAGNYAMCGRAYNPRFLFSFPNAKCSVMGSEQLSGVMDLVAGERLTKLRTEISALRKQGENDMASDMEKMLKGAEEKAAKEKSKTQAAVEFQMDVYTTSSQLLDDGIIDPRDTRYVLGMCLSVIHNQEVRGGNQNGVSRL